MNVGKSVVIKGELSGSEDLTIDGQVEGNKIEFRQHVLTIGPSGKINTTVFAKAVVVIGEVHGNITATGKISIRENGSVDGDITAPQVAIAKGAHFRGSVDTQHSQASKASTETLPEPLAKEVGAVSIRPPMVRSSRVLRRRRGLPASPPFDDD